jgi:hypothetical protein
MTELERLRDPVRLSALRAALADAGIESFVFDGQTGGIFIGVIPSRLMVADDDAELARHVLTEAGFELIKER